MVNHGNRIMVNYGIIKYSSGKIAESSSATKLLCHGVWCGQHDIAICAIDNVSSSRHYK